MKIYKRERVTRDKAGKIVPYDAGFPYYIIDNEDGKFLLEFIPSYAGAYERVPRIESRKKWEAKSANEIWVEQEEVPPDDTGWGSPGKEEYIWKITETKNLDFLVATGYDPNRLHTEFFSPLLTVGANDKPGAGVWSDTLVEVQTRIKIEEDR